MFLKFKPQKNEEDLCIYECGLRVLLITAALRGPSKYEDKIFQRRHRLFLCRCITEWVEVCLIAP